MHACTPELLVDKSREVGLIGLNVVSVIGSLVEEYSFEIRHVQNLGAIKIMRLAGML